MNDYDAAKKIVSIIDNEIYKVDHENGEYDIVNVPAEVHGHIADMIYRDHWQNETLASFINGLLYRKDEQEDEHIRQLLLDIRDVLAKLDLKN